MRGMAVSYRMFSMKGSILFIVVGILVAEETSLMTKLRVLEPTKFVLRLNISYKWDSHRVSA